MRKLIFYLHYFIIYQKNHYKWFFSFLRIIHRVDIRIFVNTLNECDIYETDIRTSELT